MFSLHSIVHNIENTQAFVMEITRKYKLGIKDRHVDCLSGHDLGQDLALPKS